MAQTEDGSLQPELSPPSLPVCMAHVHSTHTHTLSGHCNHSDCLPAGHSHWGGASMGGAERMWDAEEEPPRSIKEDFLVEVACKMRPEGGVRRGWVKMKEVV